MCEWHVGVRSWIGLRNWVGEQLQLHMGAHRHTHAHIHTAPDRRRIKRRSGNPKTAQANDDANALCPSWWWHWWWTQICRGVMLVQSGVRSEIWQEHAAAVMSVQIATQRSNAVRNFGSLRTSAERPTVCQCRHSVCNPIAMFVLDRMLPTSEARMIQLYTGL